MTHTNQTHHGRIITVAIMVFADVLLSAALLLGGNQCGPGYGASALMMITLITFGTPVWAAMALGAVAGAHASRRALGGWSLLTVVLVAWWAFAALALPHAAIYPDCSISL